MKQDDSKLMVIYAGNAIEAEMVKQILIENGIEANMKNEFMGSIAPWHVAPGGNDPIEVVILEKDKELAMTLIEEFNKAK